MCDNRTRIYGINSMGCNKSDLCNQIFDIWSRAEKSNIWITTANISWKENLDGDGESRKKKERSRMNAKQRYFQENFTLFLF